MRVRSTWEEPAEEGRRRRSLLTYVLSYDDLLAERSATMKLDDGAPFVVLGRADGDVIDMRSPDALRVPDGWASGRHAVLRHAAGLDVLSDEGSRNGTFVNGERIEHHALADGDLIEVGHSLVCYRRVDEQLVEPLLAGPPVRLGPTTTRSPEVAALVRDLAKIAPSREAILVLGETGAGKELVASTAHELSGRAGSFVPLDCGAVPESLFESTLFGHRRGAFTGALDARTGEIVRADRGTLFLDEVGNMPAASQAKLLRVLETGTVTPLGATDSSKVDVRWIAATNADLLSEATGFREDLLRRLGGYVARLPALRNRREDLGTLSAHILREAGIAKASITAPAGRKLFSSAFPGNIRQLRTALRSAALLASGTPIEPCHLSHLEVPPASLERAELDDATRRRTLPEPPSSPPARRSNGPIDAAAIESALTRVQGNVVQAARLLDTHPRQLYRWMEKLGVSLDRFRV